MASPCQAPEAKKTVAEALAEPMRLCRKWKRFMTIDGCFWQTLRENLINISYATYASMQEVLCIDG